MAETQQLVQVTDEEVEEIITGEEALKTAIKALTAKCGVCGKTLKSHSPTKLVKCLRTFVYIKDDELPLEDVPDAVQLVMRLELPLEFEQSGRDCVITLHEEIVPTQAPALTICSLLLKHHSLEPTVE